MTDLIERLRCGAPASESWCELSSRTNTERAEAADRIAALEKQNAELLAALNENWISVREKMPELIPLSPTTFVARSEEVLICGWVNKEFYVGTADLRLGGQGINDRAVRWNSHRDIFWGEEHLISHWGQMPRKPAKCKPSKQEVSTVQPDPIDSPTRPRLIPDVECKQGKCACTTTGCWGKCSLVISQNQELPK